MSSLYAMRRANGDWFALAEHGRFRVPLFSSKWDGMLARTGHWGMQLFKPVALDVGALADFVAPDGDAEVCFWLVDNPFTHLNRGRPLAQAQLALLVNNAGQRAQG